MTFKKLILARILLDCLYNQFRSVLCVNNLCILDFLTVVPNQGWYVFGTVGGQLLVVIMMGGGHQWHLVSKV